jgi:hypothetical protein
MGAPPPDDRLAPSRSLETLGAAYQLWAEQRLEHAALVARYAQERRRVEDEAQFVLGAVRAAGTPPVAGSQGALVASRDGLDAFVRDAEVKLEQARAHARAHFADQDARLRAAMEATRDEILARVQRTLATTRVRFALLLRKVAGGSAILHVERLRPDEAVLALYVLARKIPSRYDFLFDDSTEDVSREPAPLYPEEGVPEDATRPSPEQLSQRVLAEGSVLPAKGFLPVMTTTPTGASVLYRLRQRGPVMEAELLDSGAFRNVLTREEAEHLAGQFLRMKLEGRIDLEMTSG